MLGLQHLLPLGKLSPGICAWIRESLCLAKEVAIMVLCNKYPRPGWQNLALSLGLSPTLHVI